MASEPRNTLRVLQVVRPAVGGMKGHVLQLADGLRAHGIESDVACPGDSQIVDPAMKAGHTVYPIPLTGPLHLLRDPEAVWVLRDIMRERHYDIVHAHGFKAALVTRLAAMLAGQRKVIVTVHNPIMYRRDISYLTKKRYTIVENRLAGRTTRYITVSEALRRELIDAFGVPGRKVTTIYAGLDLSPFLEQRDRLAARERYGLSPDAVVFGLAARFAPQKAMDVLAQAALPVLERFPKAAFVLGGSGPLLEPCRKIARDAGVTDRMLFPGFETDVPVLLTALDVYASSALSEGLGLATIEAMAAGLPVVNTLGGGTPEVVEDGVTGYLVEPRDVDGLAEAMMRLARDAELRASMGEAGRERALELFDEKRMFELTAALYREVA